MSACRHRPGRNRGSIFLGLAAGLFAASVPGRRLRGHRVRRSAPRAARPRARRRARRRAATRSPVRSPGARPVGRSRSPQVRDLRWSESASPSTPMSAHALRKAGGGERRGHHRADRPRRLPVRLDCAAASTPSATPPPSIAPPSTPTSIRARAISDDHSASHRRSASLDRIRPPPAPAPPRSAAGGRVPATVTKGRPRHRGHLARAGTFTTRFGR
jgi:hypothetical protein